MKNLHKKTFIKKICTLALVAALLVPMSITTFADDSNSSAGVLQGYDDMMESAANNASSESSSAPSAPAPATENPPSANQGSETPASTVPGPYAANESGEVMVLMYHHFVESYQGGNRSITTTLTDFRNFLQTIYDQGYRPVSMNDFINNTIHLSAGYRPIVLSFDDGWASQFSFLEKDGQLQVDPNTAVGVLQEFNRTHPDFALRGIFYINLGQSTFGKVGTLSQRLNYLIDQGFEIGNHTYSHKNLKGLTAAEITEEIGKNQWMMDQLVPGYKFTSLALPYGNNNKENLAAIQSGTYNGVSYENKTIFLAGWKPSDIPGTSNATYTSTRIVAPGMDAIDMDATWWLKDAQNNPSRYYVSDGNPSTGANIVQ